MNEPIEVSYVIDHLSKSIFIEGPLYHNTGDPILEKIISASNANSGFVAFNKWKCKYINSVKVHNISLRIHTSNGDFSHIAFNIYMHVAGSVEEPHLQVLTINLYDQHPIIDTLVSIYKRFQKVSVSLQEFALAFYDRPLSINGFERWFIDLIPKEDYAHLTEQIYKQASDLENTLLQAWKAYIRATKPGLEKIFPPTEKIQPTFNRKQVYEKEPL